MPKLDQKSFDVLIARVREGNANAASELVTLYEPEILRDIRLRLTDARLRRTLDSMDVCQSVFGNFFVRVALGQIDFDRPGQLLRLLSTMARNKVIDRHRREKVRRPKNASHPFCEDLRTNEPHDPGESPSQIVAGQEMVELVESKLSPEERTIAAMRRRGKTWAEIGEKLNESGEALRKRLARSCRRVLAELGIEEQNPSND